MTNQLLGAVELGLVYGLMVLGVFITFRILKIPDLTVDGSITLGMAVSAMITNAGHPILAIFIALAAGALAGSCTAFFQTKVKIPSILAGIMTMSALYSINLLIMNNGTPNISILGADTVFSLFQDLTGLSKHASMIIAGLIICGIVVALVEFFFTTHTGLCICATGDNEAMVRATSVSTTKMKWIALALANGCVAISGAVYTQYMGYADVTAGSGTIVIGFASVIIGETLCVKRSLPVGFVSAIVGSVAYRLIIAVAIKTNLFPTYFLKLISVLIIAVALAVGPVKAAMTERRNKIRRERENAANS
ncbi:MAG TPA: ABC transporter permease [Candidatus Avidehalobacter gallistercoris]|uniref:ABC transporter permease n=1 Tax=Candidatus Avidehalobacter gallistercoris TaxID=2840694 RepID=A0A9D1HJ42_9FIRM|nr:ABC transporter permease [Candidatus Avidehalobacter gallistercoris]